MENIEYYKINEVLEHKYYQVPQELFINPLYKNKLNSDSKILYGFLLDRLTLSIKNNWYDESGNIYLIFTREEVQEKLNLSEKTVIKAFRQLNEVNLIKEKRQGLGRPNLIFVGKIIHQDIKEFPELENVQFQNCKNYSSRTVNSTTQELEDLQAINTNNINTNSINLHIENEEITLEEIKSKSKLNEFEQEEKCILEDVIERLYNSKILKIGDVNIDNSKILNKLKLIDKNNLIQLLNIRNQSKNIKNIINYLMICLYNNLGNANVNISTNNKKNSYNNCASREYSDDFFESLYDNLSFA